MQQKNFVKTIIFMIVIELLLGMAALTLSMRWLVVAAMIVHIALSIWAGTILRWLTRRGSIERWAEYAYWLLFFIGLPPLQWFVALHQATKARYLPLDGSKAAPTAQQHPAPEAPRHKQTTLPLETPQGPLPAAPKARWPAGAALIMVLLAGLLNLLVAMMSTAEFRGLAMLYLHALVLTPLLLIIPGLLRLPAAASVKPLVVVCQTLVYLLLATSWLIFLGR